MTFEQKIVVGLEDIKAISFECAQCRTRVTMSPDDPQVPRRCQKCDAVWVVGSPSNMAGTSPHLNLAHAISEIRKQLKEKNVPFRILLEFDAAPIRRIPFEE